VARRLLPCGLFARKHNLNVPCLSELYFLYSMLEGNRIDPGPFLVNQLYSAAISSAHTIVIKGLITPLLGWLELTRTLMIQSQVQSG